MSELIIHPSPPLHGRIQVPGDKSISHRALLFGALAQGDSHIQGFLPSGDCLATKAVLGAIGVKIDTLDATTLIIHGQGLHGLQMPNAPLDCVRSGTTMRLLAGILAGQSFESTLTGSPQLRRRPMQRIITPLEQMGAQITPAIASADGYAPLRIQGQPLRGYCHHLAVASAQVKSAILLAGLYVNGSGQDVTTIVHQPGPARDHTERMLAAMGADIEVDGLRVAITPGRELQPMEMTIPGDMSSATFPLVAALLIPGSQVTIENTGVNATRTGLLDVLRAMGANITQENRPEQTGEPVATLIATGAELHGATIEGDTVVRMIDEFPILAVAATQAHGQTVVRDAAELRVKETDRIATIAQELQALGARIETRPDGFVVDGPTPLHGGTVDSHNDHRVAMALAVAGLVAQEEVRIKNAQCIADSFPGFIALMQQLGASYEN